MHAPSASHIASHIYLLSWSYILMMRERDVCTLGNILMVGRRSRRVLKILSSASGPYQLIHSIDFALPSHLARPVLELSRRALCGRDAVYGLGPR
jgi:hypothetical protein